MSNPPKTEPHYWLQHSRWLFVGGSLIAAIVDLIAEGPGDLVGLVLLCACVSVICTWSLSGKPTLYGTVIVIITALLVLS